MVENLYVDLIGGIAGTLTTVSFFPQVIKVVRTRSTHDLSLGMFSMFTAGVAMWCVFGVMIESWPVILTNVVTLTASAVILVYKLRLG